MKVQTSFGVSYFSFHLKAPIVLQHQQQQQLQVFVNGKQTITQVARRAGLILIAINLLLPLAADVN